MSDFTQQVSAQERQANSSSAPSRIDTASAWAAVKTPDQTSPHQKEDAARVMSRTDSWKPSLARRQSYDPQDQKHEMQMSSVSGLKEEPGFSERSA
ncbi:hypothetical protein DL766_000447 [Monosporascus sp. MC13-8B]|uniref:Uncharacterized protein n=1 Tax=Monosporascus cannonballus TaxID=155416 RepID=A0ABY0H5V4_9PEZI|nr:hypothetical protein DL762_005212 [Monosporascus cannonballus]RYP00206.1 hypothetical protein DL763_000975 [Monosporascus cannonballus]RYP39295.1 hypothetical protein DL766_000447 [Monosporascus sp. MC13-8B]